MGTLCKNISTIVVNMQKKEAFSRPLLYGYVLSKSGFFGKAKEAMILNARIPTITIKE